MGIVINRGNPFARTETVSMGRSIQFYPYPVKVENMGIFRGGVVFRSSRWPAYSSVELLGRSSREGAGRVQLIGNELNNLTFRRWPFGFYNYISLRKER